MWERFSAGASNQISLMKWVYGVQPDEPEATASMPMLPKIALRGNFSLIIAHFISEITDCTQQQKTSPGQLLSRFLQLLRPPLTSPNHDTYKH